MNLPDGHAAQSSAQNAAERPVTWIAEFVNELLMSVDSIMSNINRKHEEDDETVLERIKSLSIDLDELRLLRSTAEESVSDWRREEFCRMTAEVTEAYREFCSLAYDCFRDQPADVDLSDAGPECYERVMKAIDALGEAIYWIPNAYEILGGEDDVDDVTESESGIPFEQIMRFAKSCDRELRVFKSVTNNLIEGGIPQESISRLKTFEHLVEFLEIPSETPRSRLAWELHKAADIMLAKRHANSTMPASGPPAGQTDETNGKPQERHSEQSDESVQLPPSQAKAWASYEYAENALSTSCDKVTDPEAYAWLKENGLDEYELPIFKTWCRYVGAARNALGKNKNTPRTGRTGRSIRNADDL